MPLQVALLSCPHDHRDQVERLGVFRTQEAARTAMTGNRRPARRRRTSAGPGTAIRSQEVDGRTLVRKLRCSVYTRKSSEEGLNMDFNSLDAQRESCEAYIASQKAEGWLPAA